MEEAYFEIRSSVVPALGVAFAALCIWLTVRIVNRKERWAKWTLTAAVGLPVLYVLSFGPACWIASYMHAPLLPVSITYRPLAKVAWYMPGLSAVPFALVQYGTLYEDKNNRIAADVIWYSTD